jgi:hypothetical protein
MLSLHVNCGEDGSAIPFAYLGAWPLQSAALVEEAEWQKRNIKRPVPPDPRLWTLRDLHIDLPSGERFTLSAHYHEPRGDTVIVVHIDDKPLFNFAACRMPVPSAFSPALLFCTPLNLRVEVQLGPADAAGTP